MQPKTAKRRSAFRRANRTMPRRRIDIAAEAIDYKNPDLLQQVRHRERQDSAAPRHRNAGAYAPQDHARNQAQPFGALDEVTAARRFSVAPSVTAGPGGIDPAVGGISERRSKLVPNYGDDAIGQRIVVERDVFAELEPTALLLVSLRRCC